MYSHNVLKTRFVSGLRLLVFLWENGLRNLGTFLKFRKSLWDFEASEIVVQKVHNSSISDSVVEYGYIQLCNSVISQPEIINKFKSNISYRRILEHLSPYQGLLYLNLARKSQNFNKSLIAVTSIIDDIGGGEIYKYKNYGHASPTSLRYLKVYCDLIDLFGSLENFTVSEIGCGYGGQSVLIRSLFKTKHYFYFDLPEVLNLINAFLGQTSLFRNFSLIDGRIPIEIKSELVISNYAFSELSKNLQNEYLEKVILPAKMGYITWNNLAHASLDGYSLEELVSMIPGSFLLKDGPSFEKETRIIVWGSVNSMKHR